MEYVFRGQDQLAVSYALIGTTLAWAGSALNLDPAIFRNVGASILGLLGLILMSSALQHRFASVTAGIGNTGNKLIERMHLDSLWGQFAVGLVLGIVWSPCVGPTLGAAVLLASQGSQLPQVALLMGVFGVGAALPVVALAYVSRAAMSRIRGNLMQAGKTGKLILGALMVAVAAMIVSGLDRPVESWLVDQSPAWLTKMTTQF
jgi:cytochrome c-type biogenesis protein